MKIAIVHDHLIQEGGAEKVLKVFLDMWPDSPVYTLVYDEEKMGRIFAKDRIITSFLQRFPGAIKHYQWYLPFMPAATESYDLTKYDVVLTSSSALAKGVITHSHTLNICYCHTPTRYLWSDMNSYIEGLPYPRPIKSILPHVLSKLRLWDQLASQRVDEFIANSQFVSHRIKKYYNRGSTVIYPPVETNNFSISNNVEKYYLAGGRLVPYKRFDIVIKAFNQLGIQLKIFGEGPQMEALRRMSKDNIQFMGKVSEDELRELYARCTAFIHPQIEDFGITAIEAMASGRPVIAFSGGGAQETVIDKVTGEFFDEQSWEALADKVVRFKPHSFNPIEIKKYSEKFSVERFKKEILEFVEQKYKERFRT